jgi:hypothetical protein
MLVVAPVFQLDVLQPLHHVVGAASGIIMRVFKRKALGDERTRIYQAFRNQLDRAVDAENDVRSSQGIPARITFSPGRTAANASSTAVGRLFVIIASPKALIECPT